jgi:Zn-finger nucleic acid-binding protein
MCSAPLVPSTHEFVTVSACPDGHGTWLDHAHLLEVVKSRAEDRSPAQEDTALAESGTVAIDDLEGEQLPCPECTNDMRKMNYAYESGVIIDVCTGHGIWLDQGELERIEAWVEGSERVAVGERSEWVPKLREMERDSRRTAAQQSAGVHIGPVGWITQRLAPWFEGL